MLMGTKPLPDRHPLVGTLEPIVRVKGSGSKLASASSVPRRGSWEQNPVGVVKTMALDFGEQTPMRDRSQSSRGSSSIVSSPPASGKVAKEGIAIRSSVSRALFCKMVDAKEAGSALVRKSCNTTKFSRSKSIVERDLKIPKCPFLTIGVKPEASQVISVPSRNVIVVGAYWSILLRLFMFADMDACVSHIFPMRRKAFNMVISGLEQREAVDATNNEALEQLGVGVEREIGSSESNFYFGI
ncbi:hypothetical protein Cni_G29435 [Canna indica]|uniref:Uncharacterized protein n=1 Tax=Canna indica TaxID=4628 RepID=A0AAQ3L6V2_9LILI|nr:hypothetical protein Cni_G29435 [Canna indica]